MKSCVVFALSVLFCSPWVRAAEDKETAIQYAEEAIKILESELKAAELLSSAQGSPAHIMQQKHQLQDANLTLARLRDDQTGIRQLLRAALDFETKRFQRLQELVKSGVVGSNQIRIGELHLLMARQQLALHNGDQESSDQAVRRAVEIEEKQLQRLIGLVEHGLATHSSIAQQKLRIAKLIAEGKVTLPDGN
jgi:multidrug resistance efflux pump